MDTTKPFSTRNHILKELSADSLARLRPHIERLDLKLGANLFRPNEEITHVYFPEGAMASIVANTERGQSCEIGVVGREGAVGLDVLMGADSSPHESMIQIANSVYRIPTAVIRKEFKRGEETQDLLLRFINKLMIQISQTTLCNRLHSVDERLSRWLLMCHDRVDNSHLELTQEFLAIMLGVTRVSVTLSASSLQTIGYIKYTRGNITVLDRQGLEDSACECYKVVKTEYERVDGKRRSKRPKRSTPQ